MTTRYQLVKCMLSSIAVLQTLGLVEPRVIEAARVVASIKRLEKKGFSSAEAIEIAAEWHGLDPASAEATYKQMQEPIAVPMKELNELQPLDEGADEEPD